MTNPHQQALTQQFEGFDFNRAQDPKKSAKDAFADLSKRAPTAAPIHDKPALGGWFDQHVKPGMNALGHNVSSVQGDKFRFKNWQGEFDVDYGLRAGAPGGALGWQAEDVNAPQAPPGVPLAQRQGQPIGSVMPGQTSDSLFEQIMASLQAQNAPDPQELLQQQLR